MSSVRLSIEEMAYLLGMAGGSQQSGIFLRLTYSDMGTEELEGRLLSAAHSLLARGWLILDESKKRISPELQIYLDYLLKSDYSIRVSKIVPGSEEQVVNYFFHTGAVVEQRLEHGVVIHLELIHDRENVFHRIQTLLEIPENSGSEVGEVGRIHADRLQEAKELAERGKRKEAVKLLADEGLDSALAEELAAEIANAQWRASILKLIPHMERVTSGGGFLALPGPTRPWLFDVTSHEPPLARILPGNRTTLWELYLKLIEACDN